MVSVSLVPKLCSACKQLLPLEDFSRDNRASTGLQSQCKVCRRPACDAWRAAHPNASREWKAKNREHLRRYKREYHAAHPEQQRTANLRRKFSLTPVEYATMLTAQGGVCAICGNADERRMLSVDHDHATGAVRGLLCSNCNRAIGWLHDDPDLLRAAIEYLTGVLR